MSDTPNPGALSNGPAVNINTLRSDKTLSHQIRDELRLHHGLQYETSDVIIQTETGWPIAVLARLKDGREVTHSVVYIGGFGPVTT